MRYFEHSQDIRRKLLSEEDMLTKAKRAFNGDIEEFSFGSTVNLYRIGKLPSGFYVALRVFRKDGNFGKSSLDMQKSLLEDYCQNAEELDSEGKEVPKFCIGTVYGRKAGIFTQDLTADGTENFEHYPAYDFAWVGEGTNRRKVFVDIDHLFKHRWEKKPKYFLKKHLIRLKKG